MHHLPKPVRSYSATRAQQVTRKRAAKPLGVKRPPAAKKPAARITAKSV